MSLEEPIDGVVPPPELRQVTDPRTMRALTHPVRIALIEELSLSGPLTATEAGHRIGESATTCSFHLRQLAKYGFVEEAGGGKGRARPWRMTSVGMTISTDDRPETQSASAALLRLLRERNLGRFREWIEARGSFSKEWREAAIEDEYMFYVTAEEASALSDEIRALLMSRYRDRLTDPTKRPAGSMAFETLVLGYPVARYSGE